MKIDMSAKAITNRLKTVNQLRKACLSLANSSAGKIIRKKFAANPNPKPIRIDLTCPIPKKREKPQQL